MKLSLQTSEFARLARMAVPALLLLAGGLSQANQRACIYDLVGTSGDQYNIAKDYAIAMQRAGASIELKGYTDERAAAEDFRTGQCDILMATAFRTRAFSPLSGSIDSLGATTILRDGKIDMEASYKVVHRAMQAFASPAAAKLLVDSTGNYEFGGLMVAGAAYPMVNDRRLNTVEALAGKRIAAFDHDKAQAAMIQRIGAQPVSADITNFATKFNNGVVDMIGAPALAYNPLELYRGLGKNGAVVRFPMLTITYQVVFNRNRLPAGFGQASRDYWLQHYDGTMVFIYNAEKNIPASMWVDLTPENALKYTLMLREARIEITEKGLYNRRGLRILKKIRCSIVPSDSECSLDAELN